MSRGRLRPAIPILLASASSLWLLSCDRPSGSGTGDSVELEERLVVGDWMAEAGLMVLGWAGGRPELRAAVDPSLRLWRRESPLPAVEVARASGDQTLVLRAPGGAAYRWDLGQPRAAGIEVAPEAGWSSFRGAVAFWEQTEITITDAAGSRTHVSPVPVEWAGPLPDGAALALGRRDGEAVVLVLGEGSDVVAQASLDVRPPGLLTAFSRSVVFPSGAAEELVVVRVPDLEVENRWEFRRGVTALALSGSSHEIYAARSGGRIDAVNRISGNRRELARLGAEISELRPGVFGQALLAATVEGVFLVSLSGAPAVRLPFEWRADLPLALPTGEILGVREDSLFLARVDQGARTAVQLEPVDGPVDAWWLPVRWRPDAVRVADGAGRRPADTAEAAPDYETADATDEGPGRAAPPDAGGAGEDAASARTPAEDGRGGTDSLAAMLAAPAAGYYAVVLAARTASGVIELVGTLARSGYPTAVQRRRDDAGELWYRALVGPYPARERADAAARQLRRERGLDAWVIELTAGMEGEF
jgi:hypothetical protein